MVSGRQLEVMLQRLLITYLNDFKCIEDYLFCMKKNSYDFVIFYEHVDREYEIAELLQKKISELSNKKGKILSIIFQRHLLLVYKPSLIIFPSLSWYEINFIYYLFGMRVDLVSLNFEQMLSTFNKNVKAPKGDVIKNNILHFSWTNEYRDYLIKNGVSFDRIRVTDKYVYQVFCEKIENNNLYNINSKLSFEKVVFVPLTDLQAFKSDDRIKREFGSGPLFDEAIERRDFVLKSIEIILDWIYRIASAKSSVCFIIRPHPSVGICNYQSLTEKNNFPNLKNVIYSYEGAAVDYFAKSDLLITNYSSLLLDANFFGLKGFILAPLSFPKNLTYQWFNDFKILNSYSELQFVLEQILNDDGNAQNVKFSAKSKGIDDAAKYIHEWARIMNESSSISKRLNYRFLLNYQLIKFFIASVIRLILLLKFKFLLNEGFLRDGTKIIK